MGLHDHHISLIRNITAIHMGLPYISPWPSCGTGLLRAVGMNFHVAIYSFFLGKRFSTNLTRVWDPHNIKSIAFMNGLRPASSSNNIVTSTIVWAVDMGVLLLREEFAINSMAEK